ncbi:hypothetical protein [Microbacterium sp. LWH10-1.2]|uniref:hypothetical protein n=1 Tax=unclassified Microbacterium TaxID=2609290 RepID=UPI00313A091F
MANASDTKAGDGLVIPDKIPGDDLKPDNIRAAADALDTVATSYNTTADDVDTAWAAIPASFVAPGAEIVYAGMSKPTQSARTFATKVGTVTGALRTYADSLAAVKKTLKAIKADAETFLTEFDANHRVWMNARDTQEYEWDSNLGAGTAATARGMGAGGEDPIAYLRGRGETARSKGGTAQIRVHWSQSGDHVARNNALMDRIADAYAKVNALEVECANTINGQRDDCVAELTPVEAWQLKQGGENTVDLPWGHRTDEQRNCGESFGNGIVSSAVGAIQGLGGLIGYNPIKNQFWDGEHALQAWGGTLTAVGSLLIVSTNPLAPLLGSLGVPIYKEATDNTASMVKGLVAWDTWATNPAEAAGAVVFNVGTLFIPGVNVAKGLSILSKFEIVAGAITKVDKIVSKLDDLFPGGKPPHVDIDAPRLDTHLPDTHLPDGTGAPRVHIDEPDTPTIPHDTTPPVRDHDGPGTHEDPPTPHESLGGKADGSDGAHGDGEGSGTSHSVDTEGHGGTDDRSDSGGGNGDGLSNTDNGPHESGDSSGIPPEDQARIDRYEQLINATNPDGTARFNDWVRRMWEGEIFNIENHHRYPVNELHVTRPGDGNYNRIDSFIPDQEVVSRKNTQLSGIEPSTANSYLNELVNKYGLRRDDIVIADTPSNRRDLENAGYDPDDYIGEPLNGQQVLEVPVQKEWPSLDFLLRAEDKRVAIRDATGTSWVVSVDRATVVEIRADGTSVAHPALLRK